MEGEDFFTSERAVIEFAYRARKLTNDQNVSPTLANNSSSVSSQQNGENEGESDEQPVYFQGLWPHLKDLGWKCLPGQVQGTYMYLLPNVSSSTFKDGKNGFTSKEAVLKFARVNVPKAYTLARQSVRKVSTVSATSSTRNTQESARSSAPKVSNRSLVFDAIWPTLSLTNWRVVDGETCHFKTPNGDILRDEVDVVMYLQANLKHLISGSILEEQDSIASMLETIRKECEYNMSVQYDTAGDLLEYAEEHWPATWKAILVSSTMNLFESLADVLSVVGVVKVEGRKRFTSASGWNTTEEGVNSFENKFQVVCHVANKMGRYLDLSLKGITKTRMFPQEGVLKVLNPILHELGWSTQDGTFIKPNDNDGVGLSGKAVVELVCRKMPVLWKTALLLYDYEQRFVDEKAEPSKMNSHRGKVVGRQAETRPQAQTYSSNDSVATPVQNSVAAGDDSGDFKQEDGNGDEDTTQDPVYSASKESPERPPVPEDLSQPASEATAPSSIARVGITQQDTCVQEEIFGLSPIAGSVDGQTPARAPADASCSPERASPVRPLSPVVTRSQKKAKKRKARVTPTETPNTRPKRRNDVSVRYCQGPKCTNKISAYGADYCSQHCLSQADKRRQQLEAEKAAQKSKAKRKNKKSAMKASKASKAELQEFDTLWSLLEEKGWKKGRESGCGVYVLPKVKKNKRIIGKNTFQSKAAVINHVREKCEAIYDAVYNADDSNSDGALATPMINGVKGKSRLSCKKAREFCKRNGQSTRTHLFNVIYKILKAEFGWKYFTSSVSLESSYCYAMPHVKSVKAGTVGKDIFHKKEDVVVYVKNNMQEVWERVNGDYFLQIATPISQMKRTRRKRKVSIGKRVDVQAKRTKHSKSRSPSKPRKDKVARAEQTSSTTQEDLAADDGFESCGDGLESRDDLGYAEEDEDEVAEK